MPNPTPELGLQQALDGDDAANYLDTSLANSLFTIDALFNNVSGHTHGDVHQGGPISAIPVSAIPDGSITSAKLTDGTLQTVDLGDGIVTTPKLGDGAVTTPKLAANITLTTPTLNSPTINTAAETSPTISDPTINGTISGSPTFSNGPTTSDWFRVAPAGQGIFNTATGGGIGFDTTGPFMYGAYGGGHLISETGTQTLSGKTLTAPQINNASETSPSISNPNISGNLLFDAASNSAAARIALPPTAGPKISLYDAGAGSFFGLGVNASEFYLAVPASAGLELRQNNGSGAIMFGVTMATGKVQTNGPVSAQLFTAEGITSTGYGFETINSASPGGKGLANAWTTYSSERFKTDIRTMDDGVATLRRLRPVHYADKASGAPSIGLIAEEVAEVYPQLVDQDDDGETVSLDYGKLAAPILSALLEVIQRVEALEAHSDG